MDKTLNHNKFDDGPTTWRHTPPRAATRARCAIAMLLFALAVIVAALPSFAHQAVDKDTTPTATSFFSLGAAAAGN